MDISIILLKEIIIMFFLMGIGFSLFKKGLISKNGSKEMGNLLLYIIMPSIIIKSFMVKDGEGKMNLLFISFLMSFVAVLISMIISKTIFGKKNKIENFGVAFSNVGFIGIPLIQGTLGESAVFYVTPFIVLVNLLQWTYGLVVMTDRKDAIQFEKIRKNPIVISLLIGLIIFFVPIPIPMVISKTISLSSAVNAPLAMIILGSYLAQVDLKELLHSKIAYISVGIRLIVIPLVTVCFLSFLPKEYNTIKLVVLMAAATPIGSNVAIFAQLNGLDYKQAVKDVCLSTLASIVTLPVIVGLAQSIW